MSREDAHFRLRIPEDLRERVREAADENKRSMTAEIVARLEKSFSASFPMHDDELDTSKDVEVTIHIPYYLLRAIQAHEGVMGSEAEEVIRRILHEYFPGVPSIEDLARAENAVLDKVQNLYGDKSLNDDQRAKLSEIDNAALYLSHLVEVVRQNSKPTKPTPEE
ncbi:Arc family DNA-binding protein [Epibacterium ulvae]|uniref:Arc family DNA-binding protein n=1 Tax=Epibacterium ulvae TaxID=1156985 RepID=UPI0024912F3D|nr:Arc family DNA-binding protein [Epibacterium ulvae]